MKHKIIKKTNYHGSFYMIKVKYFLFWHTIMDPNDPYNLFPLTLDTLDEAIEYVKSDSFNGECEVVYIHKSH